ncbi:MAG: type II toxin-antitoxin system VapC family toxin [Candidatus Rokuibacteriota bacterium]
MAGAAEARPPFPARVFCDSSYFYACADSDDVYHVRSLALARAAAGRGTQLWTTWDVISETVTLLRYRHSWAAAIGFLDAVRPGLRVIDYAASVRLEAEKVFRRHGRDHRLSFCDAVSFVVVTTLLERMPCFTFDEGFRRLALTAIAIPSEP